MTRSNTKTSLGFLKSIKNVKSFLSRVDSRKKKKRQQQQQSQQPQQPQHQLQQQQQQPQQPQQPQPQQQQQQPQQPQQQQQQQQSSQQQQQHETYTRQGIALTFSTEFVNTGQDPVTLLHPNLSFMPNQSASSSSFDNRAYVHYEPKKAQVALGTNPDAKHTKSLRLSVEQYAWLIQQLLEEQGVHDSILTHLGGDNSIQLVNAIHYFSNSPMLGVLSVQNYTKSLGQRLIRLVQRRQRVNDLYRQCIFMLPKALLLQAAAYIPMTKPLPAPLASINTHSLYNPPFEVIQGIYHQRLLRYCRYIPLCTHELVLGAKIDHLYHVKCTNCHYVAALQQQQQQQAVGMFSSVIEHTFMFPISFIHYPFLSNAFATNNPDSNNINNNNNNTPPPICTASAIPPQRNNESHVNSKPHAYSAFQYIPPDRTLSDNASSISAFSGIQEEEEEEEEQINEKREEGVNGENNHDECSMDSEGDNEYYDDDDEDDDDDDDEDDQANSTVQKYGYVAVDRKHEEILVVFPGMFMSHSMFENASFVPVPWHEVAESQKLKQTQNEQSMSSKSNNGSSKASKKTKSSSSHTDPALTAEEDTAPWVLECALTAWHRCEMKVVTLLMRLCSTMPAHYKVTIVGQSLGGAVASLCAFSLRSTKLLTDRLITVVAVHPPRVGNRAFVESLQEEVDTIRITDYRDITAHLPPRTSGLLHSGSSTVILPVDETNGGYVLDNLPPCESENILNRTFTLKKYESDRDRHAWGVLLDDDEETCIIQEPF